MRAVVVLVLASCAARAGAFPAPPVTYQPSKVGTKWVYEVEGTKKENVATVVAAEKQGELVVVRIRYRIEDVFDSSEIVSVGKDGIYRHAVADSLFDPHVCLLKLPVKVGEKWRTDFTAGDHKSTGTRVVEAVEEVEVPAGKFRAVRVKHEYKDNDTPRKQTLWYAPNVGVVKHAYGDNRPRVDVLKSFEVPKK
jgi:hypothetical protein